MSPPSTTELITKKKTILIKKDDIYGFNPDTL